MSDKYENEREEREKDDQNPGSGDDRAQATVIPGDDISQNSSEHLISELTESGSRLGDSNAFFNNNAETEGLNGDDGGEFKDVKMGRKREVSVSSAGLSGTTVAHPSRHDEGDVWKDDGRFQSLGEDDEDEDEEDQELGLGDEHQRGEGRSTAAATGPRKSQVSAREDNYANAEGFKQLVVSPFTSATVATQPKPKEGNQMGDQGSMEELWASDEEENPPEEEGADKGTQTTQVIEIITGVDQVWNGMKVVYEDYKELRPGIKRFTSSLTPEMAKSMKEKERQRQLVQEDMQEGSMMSMILLTKDHRHRIGLQDEDILVGAEPTMRGYAKMNEDLKERDETEQIKKVGLAQFRNILEELGGLVETHETKLGDMFGDNGDGGQTLRAEMESLKNILDNKLIHGRNPARDDPHFNRNNKNEVVEWYWTLLTALREVDRLERLLRKGVARLTPYMAQMPMDPRLQQERLRVKRELQRQEVERQQQERVEDDFFGTDQEESMSGYGQGEYEIENVGEAMEEDREEERTDGRRLKPMAYTPDQKGREKWRDRDEDDESTEGGPGSRTRSRVLEPRKRSREEDFRTPYTEIGDSSRKRGGVGVDQENDELSMTSSVMRSVNSVDWNPRVVDYVHSVLSKGGFNSRALRETIHSERTPMFFYQGFTKDGGDSTLIARFTKMTVTVDKVNPNLSRYWREVERMYGKHRISLRMMMAGMEHNAALHEKSVLKTAVLDELKNIYVWMPNYDPSVPENDYNYWIFVWMDMKIRITKLLWVEPDEEKIREALERMLEEEWIGPNETLNEAADKPFRLFAQMLQYQRDTGSAMVENSFWLVDLMRSGLRKMGKVGKHLDRILGTQISNVAEDPRTHLPKDHDLSEEAITKIQGSGEKTLSTHVIELLLNDMRRKGHSKKLNFMLQDVSDLVGEDRRGQDQGRSQGRGNVMVNNATVHSSGHTSGRQNNSASGSEGSGQSASRPCQCCGMYCMGKEGACTIFKNGRLDIKAMVQIPRVIYKPSASSRNLNWVFSKYFEEALRNYGFKRMKIHDAQKQEQIIKDARSEVARLYQESRGSTSSSRSVNNVMTNADKLKKLEKENKKLKEETRKLRAVAEEADDSDDTDSGIDK